MLEWRNRHTHMTQNHAGNQLWVQVPPQAPIIWVIQENGCDEFIYYIATHIEDGFKSHIIHIIFLQ